MTGNLFTGLLKNTQFLGIIIIWDINFYLKYVLMSPYFISIENKSNSYERGNIFNMEVAD